MNSDSDRDVEDLTGDQRFRLLVAGVSDYAIYLIDPAGYVNSWNAGAQRFKGYLADEIIGRHFSLFYTPEDRAAGIPANALRTALAEGKFEAEGWRVRKDGGHFWASVVIDPIRDNAGRLIGFAKITRDMTERKQAQEALRASEEQFRLLVQGVTDYAIYMLSPSGEVTNWNAGAQRIKGYTQEEVVGSHFSRFYIESDRASGAPARALETARETGRFEQESLRLRKDGTQFWAHVVIDAIHDETGRLIGFAKITRDITERKLAQEALDRANAALFQAQKMEAIGQLTGGVAHDFNNLLAVISSSVDVLNTRLHNAADLRLLESMRRAVDRGAALSQQLLSFARQQPLKVELRNLNTLIGGFEAVLRRAVNSSITFNVDLQERLKTVSVDEARFEAALLNLIVNARDAMPTGGRLTLRTQNIEVQKDEVGRLAAGWYVKVSITDTGSGMSPEVLARASEPFFTTKEIGKGTGLGLSQVYGFVAQSGGELVLESEVDKGSTVSIYLPTVEGESAEIDKANEKDTVLITDDEPDVMQAAADLFRSIGYEVLTANNGWDALDILERTSDVDLLFADVMMPNGMSGIDLARHVRKLHPEIKILLASGYALPALKDAHGSLDEFAFVNKPYRLSDLAKKLRAIE